MAISKTITANGSRGHHGFSLFVSEDTTNATNNTSSLSFTFKIYPISNGWDWYGWGSSIKYTITIDTNTYSGTIPAYDGYSTVTLKTENNIIIQHDNDGSKTINIGFVITDGANKNYTPGNTSTSSTLTLTTIQRESVFAEGNATLVNGSNIDNGLTIRITKYVDSFYDVLDVGIYSVVDGGYFILKHVYNILDGDTLEFTPAELNAIYGVSIPNTYARLVLYLRSYSDNTYETQVGSTDNTGNLDKPLYIQTPTFNDFSYSDNNSTTTSLTNDNQTIIKGYSELNVTISTANQATANTRSTNMSHYLIDGQTVLYTGSAVSKSISNYSKDNITVYAVDERNTSSAGVNKSFVALGKYIDYSVIEKDDTQSYSRSDSGVGGYVTLNFSGSWWGNKPFSTNASAVTNSLTAKAKYRISGTSTWSAEQTLTLTLEKQSQSDTYYTLFSYNGFVNGDQPDNTFDVGESYDIMVIVSDELSSVEYNFSVHSGSPAIALYKNKASLGAKYDETLGGTQLWGNTYLNGDLLYIPVIPPIPTVEDLNVYSYTETIIGTYDDEPLYRKIIDFGYLPNGTDANFVAHNISDLSAITKIEAIGYDGTRWFPIPFAPIATMFSSTSCSIRVDDSDVVIASSKDMSNYTCIVVLEYTKISQ